MLAPLRSATPLVLLLASLACESAEGTPIDDASVQDVAASPDASVDTGTPDVGVDAAAACAYPMACPMTRGLGMVSGDTTPATGDTVTATGDTSEWLSVRVTEDDNSIIGRALVLDVVLTPPPGSTYALYLYVNDGSALAECTNVTATGTEADGGSLEAKATWGETTGGVANGKDDSATVTIRVQHLTGMCSPSNAWSLEATGNVQ